jgi:hypothetical protein
MKSNTDDIRGEILGLEMEISLYQHDLKRIEIDSYYLDKIQRDLMYNIDFLRRGEIISVLMEYQKSIEALKNVRTQIIDLRNKKQELETQIEIRVTQIDGLYKAFEAQAMNILVFTKK